MQYDWKSTMMNFMSVIAVITLIKCSSACPCLFTKPEMAFCGFELVGISLLVFDVYLIFLIMPLKTRRENVQVDREITCENVAKFVIEGVVNNVQEIVYEDGYGKYFGVPDELKHNITVIRVFRKTEDIENIESGDTLNFYTPGSRPMCGIRLAVNTRHLITAYKYNEKLQFNLCSWLPRMAVLTPEQINGIEGGYDCTGM